MVLDEATSHLDTINERAARTALSQLMADRTTIVVVHRLSTIRAADLILVLEGGAVGGVRDTRGVARAWRGVRPAGGPAVGGGGVSGTCASRLCWPGSINPAHYVVCSGLIG